MTDDRCKCGYLKADHEPDTGRCPLCACGRTSAEHVPIFDPPSPLLADEHRFIAAICPGKPKSEAGKWPTLRRGSFDSPPQQRYATRPGWGDVLFPVIEQQKEDVTETPSLSPQVPARPPCDAGEFAAGNGRQARGLGRRAAAAGWQVDALYWRSGDGVEGCAVRLAKDRFRAVATWKRPAGQQGSAKGWAADVAYAWRLDARRFPQQVKHSELEGYL